MLFDFLFSKKPKLIEASGNYYFDVAMCMTNRAKAIRIPGYDKPIPYHYKLKTGEITLSKSCILIWSSSNFLGTAYEDPNLEYARLGALIDLIEYGRFVEINFLEEFE